MNSLGFDLAPADTRVVVAMSGGVDSSVTAALLAAEGYDVVGITLQLYDHGAATTRRVGSCCAGQDIYDAGRVADRIGIPHYVLDYESRFRAEVMDTFAEAYINGETPIPCIACNRTVKFRDLLSAAGDLGARALATGHYVRRVLGREGPELHCARDAGKDQSYFLFHTTRLQLQMLRFPLGDLDKAETRALAQRFDLPVASKPDSQDICFVPDGDYAAVVERLRPQAGETGEIVDLAGNVLGRHDGIVHFTVGQRRGLGIGGRSAESEPLFVVRLEPQSRRVVVGPRSALARRSIRLRDVNWLDSERPEEPRDCLVRCRSSQPLRPAQVGSDAAGALEVTFAEPELGAAPGQACVIYDAASGTRVLGGGFITRPAGPARLAAVA